jgi:hypothetical protein
VLRVVVDAVTNPERRNLSLVLTAVSPPSVPASPLAIGRLSFYPANQGGSFLLPLPGPVLDRLEADRALTVVCALEVESGEGLEATAVQLRSLTLAPAP